MLSDYDAFYNVPRDSGVIRPYLSSILLMSSIFSWSAQFINVGFVVRRWRLQ